MSDQMSLFGVAVDLDAPPRKRRPPARRQAMRDEQCPGCGDWFKSFCRGVRCDRCRKEQRQARRSQPEKNLQMGPGDTWEEWVPGY